jgi:hypothetical protein
VTTNQYAEIDRLAPIMNALLPHDEATYDYHLMSDAFIWEDELPSFDVGDDLVIRYLLRFRTSLLIGSPIDSLREYWEFAKTRWSKWPGFRPDRTAYSARFKAEYDNYQAKEEEFLSSFDD